MQCCSRLFMMTVVVVLFLHPHSTFAADRLLDETNRINWLTVNNLFNRQERVTPTVDVQSRTFNTLRTQRRHLKHNGQPYQADTVTGRSGMHSLNGVRITIGNQIVYRFYLHDEHGITNITFQSNDTQAQIDQLSLPAELDDDTVHVPPTFDNNPPPPSADLQGSATSTLTMMVVFTTASLNQAGGLANMLAAINNSIAESNTTLTNSLIDAQVVLVHTAEVSNCMELSPLGQGTNAGNQLGLLANPSDGCNDQVHALRDQAGIEADLVQGVVSQFQGSVAGIGYLWQSYCWNNGCDFSPNGFSLVLRGYETYSGTHEMGHNLGCNHNPENAGSSSPILPGGFGHFGSNWRTQMSYGTQTRIPYFSNPNLTYNTNPIGIVNQRDNSALLRLTIPVAANWRGGGGTTGQPPDPVNNVTATQNLIERVNLTWSASAQATSYEVFRNGVCTGTPLLTVNTTQSSDIALPAFSTLYNYAVRALNANGPSSCSVAVNGMALPKSTPVNAFAASDGTFHNQIDLTWDAVDSGATSMLRIFRSNAASTIGCQAADEILSLGTISTNYSDMTAMANSNYRYSILRINLDDSPSDCITDTGFTWSTQTTPTNNNSNDNQQTSNFVTNSGDSKSIIQSAACGLLVAPQPVSFLATLIIITLVFILLASYRRY